MAAPRPHNDTAAGTPPRPRTTAWLAVAAVLALAGAGLWATGTHNARAQEDKPAAASAGKVRTDLVRIASNQAQALDVGLPQAHEFAHQRRAIGIIDFNQDRTVRVYSANQGRIAQMLVKAGDEVRAGQPLFTVAVPDMAQAASALLASAATLRTANATLQRANALVQEHSIAQKEWQQAQSDQQTAQAAYDGARQSLRLLQLSEAEIQRIEQERLVGKDIAVKSPIAGRVTARAGQNGLLVQPGADPAPVVISDMRSLWMVASVPESEMGDYRLGQSVQVRVPAWPDKVFSGKVSYIGDTVDADTRRLAVRAEVADPGHLLRPQMTAEFDIRTAPAQTSIAVPAQAVVREGNGNDVVWVAQDSDAGGPRFVRRTVVRGLSDAGLVQITQGLAANEPLARRNALFLSSLYESTAAADAGER
ncbi:MAG: efflux RND transporter periplasmic adaptor subunit [Comamonadaceae bacterium]|nr:efflux RND transporter periplasmic adaptor subunit [Comamonadaceae bacterium]